VRSKKEASGLAIAPPAKSLQGKPKALELCAGSAGATAALVEAGFDAMGIDHSFNRHRAKAPVLLHDLSSPEGLAAIMAMLGDTGPKFVWAGPPCGTFSRAREKRVSRRFRERGAPDPQPLRSEDFPYGLASLNAIDMQKVLSANALVRNLADFVHCAHRDGVFWAIENPARSLLWHTDEMRSLAALPGVYDVVCSACEFGSDRDKRTRFRTNLPELAALGRTCAGSHPPRGPGGELHAPWTVEKRDGAWHFPTAEECEYPPALCEAIATAAAAGVRRAHNAVLRPTSCQPSSSPRSPATPAPTAGSGSAIGRRDAGRKAERARRRAQVGVQSRGRAMPALLPEYRQQFVASVRGEDLDNFAVKSAIPAPVTLGAVTIPAKAVVFRVDKPPEPDKGGSGEGSAGEEGKEFAAGSEAQVHFGVHWKPEQFFEAAKEVLHPYDACDYVPDDVKRAIVSTVNRPPDVVMQEREATLLAWEARARELQNSEDALHAAMHPEIANIYSGKRFLLLQEMLACIGWEDAQLVGDLVSGMPLAGELPATGVFPRERREPLRSIEWLWATAKQTRECIKADARSSDPELEEFIRKETAEEVRRGWAAGPYTEEELSRELGPLWVASHRFAVRGAKLRVIDDYSMSHVNATVGVQERIALGDLDTIASNVKAWACAMREPENFAYAGEGPAPRASCGSREDRKLVGRVVDLAHAFRQIAVRRSHAPLAVFAVRAKDGSLGWYRQIALPFGATACVWNFNRAARAIHALLTRLLNVCNSNYYDDFVLLELDTLAAHTQSVVDRFMQLIGWAVKRGDKDLDFGSSFCALGVQLDLSAVVSEGALLVANKPGKREDLVKDIGTILEAGVLKPSRAAQLRGKLTWSASHLFGRCGARACRALSLHAARCGRVSELDAEVAAALRWWTRYLTTAAARRVDLSVGTLPVLIFTDGAYEQGKATVGGVLYDPLDQTVECFGAEVPHQLVARWHATGIEQVIGQAEILPAIVARLLWGDRLRGRKCINFVDNEAAREGLVQGRSRSQASSELLDAFWELEAHLGCCSWFDRVPSPANISDGPSRLDFSNLALAAAVIREFPSLPRSLVRGLHEEGHVAWK
jgi:hypothetical protein